MKEFKVDTKSMALVFQGVGGPVDTPTGHECAGLDGERGLLVRSLSSMGRETPRPHIWLDRWVLNPVAGLGLIGCRISAAAFLGGSCTECLQAMKTQEYTTGAKSGKCDLHARSSGAVKDRGDRHNTKLKRKEGLTPPPQPLSHSEG